MASDSSATDSEISMDSCDDEDKSSISINSSASNARFARQLSLCSSPSTFRSGSSDIVSPSLLSPEMKTKIFDLEEYRCGCLDNCMMKYNNLREVILTVQHNIRMMNPADKKRYLFHDIVQSAQMSINGSSYDFFFKLAGQIICWKSWIRMQDLSKRSWFRYKKAVTDVYNANPDLVVGVWQPVFERLCSLRDNNSQLPQRSKSTAQVMEVTTWLRHKFRFCDKSPESEQFSYLDLPTKYELFEAYTASQRTSGTPCIVSKSHFLKIWRLHFKHVKLRKSTNQLRCSFCTDMTERARTTLNEIELQALHNEWDEHLTSQANERAVYYKHKLKAKNFPNKYLSIIADSMDQKKSFLPKTSHANKFLDQKQLKFKVYGVAVHHVRNFMMIVPPWVHGTANLTISTLHKTLMELEHLPPILYLQLDGSSSNKNDLVLGYCSWLVNKCVFEKVKLSFLMVGHTHEDIDQTFSVISKYLKRRTCWTPQQLQQMVDTSLTQQVLHKEQSTSVEVKVTIYSHNWNVEEWLKPHIDKNLGMYRFNCHVFAFKNFSNGRVYMHYKLRAASKDWYPTMRLASRPDLPVRYWEGPKKGRTWPGEGIDVLISLPGSSEPPHIEPWSSMEVEQIPRTYLSFLETHVLPQLVPEREHDKFMSDWKEILDFDFDQVSTATANHMHWHKLVDFVSTSTVPVVEVATSTATSFLSSGEVVDPMTHSRYKQAAFQRFKNMKTARQQARNNDEIPDGAILAVMRLEADNWNTSFGLCRFESCNGSTQSPEAVLKISWMDGAHDNSSFKLCCTQKHFWSKRCENNNHEKWSGEILRSSVLVVGVQLDKKNLITASSMTEIRSAKDLNIRSKSRRLN